MASSKTDHPALIKTPHAAMVPCPRRPRFLRKWEENKKKTKSYRLKGNDSNLLIVFYVQIMPDDFVMQLHRF